MSAGSGGRGLSMEATSTGPDARRTNWMSFKTMSGRVATTSRATRSACCNSRMSGETGAVVTLPLRLRYGRRVVDPVAVTSLVRRQRMKRRTGSPSRAPNPSWIGHTWRAHLGEHIDASVGATEIDTVQRRARFVRQLFVEDRGDAALGA